jgi:hypothetical protein
MTQSEASKEQFFNLLESAEKARDGDILAPVLADIESDTQLESAYDWKALVVSEATKLAARIEFLGRHPRLPTFLGGCATKVLEPELSYDVKYLSEPVLATEPEYLDHNSVRSYYQFGVDLYDGYLGYLGRDISYLKVYSVTEEMNSGLSDRNELYKITASPTEHRSFWKVNGPEFRTFKDKKLHEIGLAYQRENPWFDRYYVFKADSWTFVKNASPQKSEDDFAVLTEVVEERKIQEELIPKLEPGPDTWQYPDELYHFPLGLLMQANEVFGTKQR